MTELLLLPGLNCDAAVWDGVAARVGGAHCRVPRPYAGHATLPAMARQVLDEAPARFALAGHSMGARVALEVLRLAPERVTHLALLATGCRALAEGPAGDDERGRRAAWLALARTGGMEAMARDWVRGMVAPARLASEPALVEAIVAMVARHTPEQCAAQVAALLARPDARPLLRRSAVPTLVGCGAHDRWAPVAQHEEIAALVPGSRRVVWPDCGHMAPMEHPAAVADALDGLLACAGTRTAATRTTQKALDTLSVPGGPR